MTESSLQPLFTQTPSLSAQHRPFPHTYLNHRLAYLQGRKTGTKSEETYLSQAEANNLQEEPLRQGAQHSPGHGGKHPAWVPQGTKTPNASLQPKGEPSCRHPSLLVIKCLGEGGRGDWRRAEGWEGED